MKREKLKWAAAFLLCLSYFVLCVALAVPQPTLADSPHEAALAELSQLDASIQAAADAARASESTTGESTTGESATGESTTGESTTGETETTTNPFFNGEEDSFLPKTGAAPHPAFLICLAVLSAGGCYCGQRALKRKRI